MCFFFPLRFPTYIQATQLEKKNRPLPKKRWVETCYLKLSMAWLSNLAGLKLKVMEHDVSKDLKSVDKSWGCRLVISISVVVSGIQTPRNLRIPVVANQHPTGGVCRSNVYPLNFTFFCPHWAMSQTKNRLNPADWDDFHDHLFFQPLHHGGSVDPYLFFFNNGQSNSPGSNMLEPSKWWWWKKKEAKKLDWFCEFFVDVFLGDLKDIGWWSKEWVAK